MQINRFILFLFIGALNTAFGYLIFSLFIYLGLHYVAASFLSTCLGVLFNFNTTGRIVFKNKDNKRIVRFLSMYMITYLVNIVLIKINNYFTDNIYISGAISTLLTALLSYNLMKRFVFIGEYAHTK